MPASNRYSKMLAATAVCLTSGECIKTMNSAVADSRDSGELGHMGSLAIWPPDPKTLKPPRLAQDSIHERMNCHKEVYLLKCTHHMETPTGFGL